MKFQIFSFPNNCGNETLSFHFPRVTVEASLFFPHLFFAKKTGGKKEEGAFCDKHQGKGDYFMHLLVFAKTVRMENAYAAIRAAIYALREYKKTCCKRRHYRDFIRKCREIREQIKKLLVIGKTLKSNYRAALERWKAELTSLQTQFRHKLKNEEVKPKVSLKNASSAFAKRLDTKILVNHRFLTPESFFHACRKKVARVLTERTQLYNAVKVFFIFNAIYELRGEPEPKSIYSKTETLFRKSPAERAESKWAKWFKRAAIPNLLKRIDEFQMNGSGYVLKEILNLSIHVNEYDPLKAGSYMPLPTVLLDKRACFNVKNEEDEFCFLYCILAKIVPEKLHRFNEFISKEHREQTYELFEQYFPEYKAKFTFPMKLNQISRFEKQYDLSVNVYTTDAKYDVIPCYLTKQSRKKIHVQPLLLRKWLHKEQKECNHYVLIVV